MKGRGDAIRAPSILGAVVVLVLGIAIAWVDSRPTWDDTGVTAGVLLLVAGAASLAGLPPWLAAVLVVGPVVLSELRHADAGLALAPIIAIAGAYGGWLLRRLGVRSFPGA
jgi:hypothetical protein